VAPHRLGRPEVGLQRVIFDSSFLMAVVARPTTWFEDIVDNVGKFEPVILDCVRAELEKLAAGEGRKARDARVSLEMASRFKAEPSGMARVDDEIASAARTTGSVVATADGELARALRASHIRVVSLKQGRVAMQ
jgi:rRNA-processing protein FCF1